MFFLNKEGGSEPGNGRDGPPLVLVAKRGHAPFHGTHIHDCCWHAFFSRPWSENYRNTHSARPKRTHTNTHPAFLRNFDNIKSATTVAEVL